MLSSLFGKILFSLFDLFCGFLIYRIFRYQRMKAETATFYASFWILNPFVMFISTRGSADTIVCFLVYCTLYFLQTGWIGCSAFVYGLAIHFKLFPVIYALYLLSLCTIPMGSRQLCSLFSLSVPFHFSP